MSKTYEMSVYTRRWGHPDVYHIQKNPEGWNVTHMMVGGPGDKTGFPGLKRCMEQDSVNYPAGITDYFEKIWDLLESKEIDEAKAQEYFNQLGNWISICEKNTPAHIYN